MIGSAAITLAIVWTMPLLADINPAQPTLKEVIGKGSKERTPVQRTTPESAQRVVPDDEFGRGTPRSTVRGFLAAAQARIF